MHSAAYATVRCLSIRSSLCTTPDPDFKGTPLFDVKYLRNGTR